MIGITRLFGKIVQARMLVGRDAKIKPTIGFATVTSIRRARREVRVPREGVFVGGTEGCGGKRRRFVDEGAEAAGETGGRGSRR